MENTPTPARPDAATQPEIFDEADRIVIAMPCYGGLAHMETAMAVAKATQLLVGLFRQADGSVVRKSLVADITYLTNESHVDRARNKCANLFWRGPWNWLMFWDADIVPEDPGLLLRLWVRGMKGARLVAMPYALKGIVPQYAMNVLPGMKADADGLAEVVHAGTGFMLIHREVFAGLIKHGRAEEYVLGHNDPHAHTMKTHWDFFKSGVRKVKAPNGEQVKLWLSEDYMLCHEWRQCGGKVFMDLCAPLGHWGAVKFPLNETELVAAYHELVRIKHPAAVPPEPKQAA